MKIPEFTPVADLSFSEALAELEAIVSRMQNEAIDIDLLTTYTRRAGELLASCRGRLTATDEELTAILTEMNPTNQ